MKLRKPLAAQLLEGERVVAVDPLLRGQTQGGWRTRLNLFAGRALSDVALTQEQVHRQMRLTMLARALSPGIAEGLDLALDHDGSAETPSPILELASGSGLTAWGEDVFVGRPARFRVDDLEVYAPAALLDSAEASLPPSPESLGAWFDFDPGADPLSGIVPLDAFGRITFGTAKFGDPAAALAYAVPKVRPLDARRLSRSSLASLRRAGAKLPRAAILVLRPATIDTIPNYDTTDPCEEDPEAHAFDDEQCIDAAHAFLYAWPEEWRSLPDPNGPAFRNELASTIFEAESMLDGVGVLPWEAVGLPIGLIAFDASAGVSFVDVWSVARLGGQLRRARHGGVPRASSALAEARLRQFSDQLIDTTKTPPAIAGSDQVRLLPPVGVLPLSSADPRGGRQSFFPSGFDVRVAPIPAEQIDAIVRDSARLAPIDLSVPDSVQLYVPVPQAFFEPSLLTKEVVDPLFDAEIDRLSGIRATWLRRRADVRSSLNALTIAQGGVAAALTFPASDPGAVEQEAVATIAPDPAEDTFGVDPASLPQGSQDLSLEVKAVQALRSAIGNDPLITPDLDKLSKFGLDSFILFLTQKADTVDDVIDFGFLRVQSDIYRLRQHMLSNTAATRLATSPVLAQIAQGDTASAVRTDLTRFFDATRVRTGPLAEPVINVAFPVMVAGTPGAASPNANEAPAVTPRAGIVLESGVHANTARVRTLATPSPVISVAAARIEPTAAARTSESLVAARTITGGSTSGGLPFRLIDPELNVDRTSVGLVSGPGSSSGSRGASFPPLGTVAGVIDSVRNQSPIDGAAPIARTTTIAERLEAPAASEARTYAKATKLDVVTALSQLPIAIDFPVPGLFNGDPSKPDSPDQRKAVSNLRDANTIALITNEPEFATADEAHHYATGVSLLEHTVATLRIIEVKIRDYRRTIDLCRQARDTVAQNIVLASQRLRSIDDGVAAAREDVGTAKRLRVEEQTRTDGINARRDAVIAEHVTYYLFARPRTVELAVPPPVRAIDPSTIESVVPECLLEPGVAPPELHAMLDVVKEAPMQWFTFTANLVGSLDRREYLFHALVGARSRAVAIPDLLALKQPQLEGPYGVRVNQTYAAHQQIIARSRLDIASLDLRGFTTSTWAAWSTRVYTSLSLGDLIDGAHGRPDIARSAATSMDHLRSITACIYERFSQVPARIRLLWAELVGQNDPSRSFRDLGPLPRFGELPHADRVGLQSLVDWIYQQFTATLPQAQTLASDLVRVALLLASHAPVGKIVSGEMQAAAKLSVGTRIDLSVLEGAARVGMHVYFYESTGRSIIAQGVVEDLAAGAARARLVSSRDANVTLPIGARVHLSDETSPLRFRTELAS